MTEVQKREALDRLYARLPTIRCQGLCQAYCGLVPMYKIEQDRIAERTGTQPRASFVPGHQNPKFVAATCPLLTPGGRCSVHDIRPLICRAWGCTKDMVCPHGCKPSRWISPKEFWSIMKKIDVLEAR